MFRGIRGNGGHLCHELVKSVIFCKLSCDEVEVGNCAITDAGFQDQHVGGGEVCLKK